MKIFLGCALGATTEIEALKDAVAEAKKKAAVEQALCKKHEARVIEAERELQEAVMKWRPWSRVYQGKNLNSPRLAKPQVLLGGKPKVP